METWKDEYRSFERVQIVHIAFMNLKRNLKWNGSNTAFAS